VNKTILQLLNVIIVKGQYWYQIFRIVLAQLSYEIYDSYGLVWVHCSLLKL